ncbi:unnamed protein product [Protopolystoma xenopodis]|uniref:Dynein heavy chain region D6 P-loop domain-containing protein n=1 Tax=Protopolystoma xenopodis TaxID=117903 RepID=A0A3S5AEE1_9PLAT|nr:unnamed protein product [Protopolystoma xenopodis]
MLHNDQITFALLITRIFLRGQIAAGSGMSLEAEFNCFLLGQEAAATGDAANKFGPSKLTGVADTGNFLSLEQIQAVTRLRRTLPAFSNLDKMLAAEEDEIIVWLDKVAPETEVPILWDVVPSISQTSHLSNIVTALHSLLIIQALRPDRLIASTHRLIMAALGENFMDMARRHLDLAGIVENEIKPSVPILLCAAPGFDPSGRVEDLASEQTRQLTGIAIGSTEGFLQADRAINSAAKTGKWVMLKNVHLAPGWLVQLEKKLHNIQPHPGFRLFLTMEISPKIPVNLLRSGRVFTFEPPPGIKVCSQIVCA